MRRDINIRKKKRLEIQETKKTYTIIACLIAILCICLYGYIYFFHTHMINNHLEQEFSQFSSLNKDIPFSIQKIILYSSATASTGKINQSVSLDISQYCDIGIYLQNIDTGNHKIQSLSIQNIHITTPQLGTPCLYKKRIHDLGKCTFNEENKIENQFNFTIIEKNNEINEDNFEIYNDGSTPLSLGFYNQNIKTGWIPNREEISYDGTLLKNAFISQSDLQCEISFAIHIQTENEECYICNVHFAIPFEDKDGTLYDNGDATKTLEGAEISKFIRIQ